MNYSSYHADSDIALSLKDNIDQLTVSSSTSQDRHVSTLAW